MLKALYQKKKSARSLETNSLGMSPEINLFVKGLIQKKRVHVFSEVFTEKKSNISVQETLPQELVLFKRLSGVN